MNIFLCFIKILTFYFISFLQEKERNCKDYFYEKAIVFVIYFSEDTLMPGTAAFFDANIRSARSSGVYKTLK